MKPQPNSRHVGLIDEGEDAINEIRSKNRVLRAAMAEGIAGLTTNVSLEDAEEILRRAARVYSDHRIHLDDPWAPEGCACFYAKDDTAYFFPI